MCLSIPLLSGGEGELVVGIGTNGKKKLSFLFYIILFLLNCDNPYFKR